MHKRIYVIAIFAILLTIGIQGTTWSQQSSSPTARSANCTSLALQPNQVECPLGLDSSSVNWTTPFRAPDSPAPHPFIQPPASTATTSVTTVPPPSPTATTSTAASVPTTTATTTTAPSGQGSATSEVVQPGDYSVSPSDFAAWSKVNVCEEGGDWSVHGATYSGGLGWTNTNWTQFNVYGFPANAGDATPDQQVYVAVHGWEPTYGGPPDQNGCSGGY